MFHLFNYRQFRGQSFPGTCPVKSIQSLPPFPARIVHPKPPMISALRRVAIDGCWVKFHSSNDCCAPIAKEKPHLPRIAFPTARAWSNDLTTRKMVITKKICSTSLSTCFIFRRVFRRVTQKSRGVTVCNLFAEVGIHRLIWLLRRL